MKPTDFATYELAKAENITTTKMTSGSQMKIYVVQQGLYLYFKNGTTDLLSATYDELISGEFNFIEGHPSTVLPLLDVMIYQQGQLDIAGSTLLVIKPDGIEHSAVVALGLLKVACISYANKVKPAFPDLSEPEYDAMVLTETLYAPTEPKLIGYPELGSNLEYAVISSGTPVKTAVVLTSPAPADMTVEVFFHTDYSYTENFDVKGLKVGYIRIKKGETNGSIDIHKSLSRKIQASAISNVICEYNLIIKG